MMTLQQRRLITLVAAAFFMEGLDGSIMNTSLPQIALGLHTTPLHLKIALTTYLLAAGIFIPISGWLADRFGTKVVFRLAIIVFLIGSIFSGFSDNLLFMVVGRIVQGIGGALSIPIGRLLFVRYFGKEDFFNAMATMSTFALLGPSLGPLVGGFLTTFIDWRFIFFVNIPVGMFALYYVQKYINNETDSHIKPFDFYGFILLAVSLTILLFSFDMISEANLPWAKTFMIMLLGVFGLFAYWIYAKKKKDLAIINLRLFDNVVFKNVVLNTISVRLGLAVIPFLGPLLLQLGLGKSAMVSGMYTGVTAIAMIAGKRIVRYLLQRISSRRLSFIICFLLFLSLNANILICYDPDPLTILSVFIINGTLASMQFTTMNSIVYTNMPKDLQTTGTSFLSSFQQILQSFGIAIAAFILYLFLQDDTATTHYPLSVFAFTYGLVSLFPLYSAWGFLKLKIQGIDLQSSKKSKNQTTAAH